MLMFDQAGLEEYQAELKEKKAKTTPGEWHSEPDRIEFKHAGFDCLIQRGGLLAWCGYVGVPPGHPFHGKDYADKWDDEYQEIIEAGPPVDVHGGLTYADGCGGAICHKAAPGEPDELWWFGFDCAHSWDLVPSTHSQGFGVGGEVYRNIAYVRKETESLAEQLRKLMQEGSAE